MTWWSAPDYTLILIWWHWSEWDLESFLQNEDIGTKRNLNSVSKVIGPRGDKFGTWYAPNQSKRGLACGGRPHSLRVHHLTSIGPPSQICLENPPRELASHSTSLTIYKLCIFLSWLLQWLFHVWTWKWSPTRCLCPKLYTSCDHNNPVRALLASSCITRSARFLPTN